MWLVAKWKKENNGSLIFGIFFLNLFQKIFVAGAINSRYNLESRACVWYEGKRLKLS